MEAQFGGEIRSAHPTPSIAVLPFGSTLGQLYGTAGKTSQAKAIFDGLRARSRSGFVPSYDIALVCLGLGWNDQAFEYLARADQEKSGWMTYINVDPRLHVLRADSRFTDLLRRVRLI